MHSLINDIIIILSLTILYLAPLVIWANRYNIPAIVSIGFCITAYAIPALAVGSQYSAGEIVFSHYFHILWIGAVFYLLGTFIGFKTTKARWLTHKINNPAKEARRINRATYFAIFSAIGMVITYGMVGFIPIFSSNQFAAKFLRGAYQLNTFENSLWRLFTTIATITLPLMIAMWLDTKKVFYMVISLALTCIFVLNLTRGPMAYSLLIVFGLFMARKNLSWLYVIIVVFAYGLGSAFYLVFGINSSFYDSSTIFTVIASGAPDIKDQIDFLNRYLQNPELTYGKTFIGGLVPGRHEWNPSVWSMTVGSSVDVTEVLSGGLRLPNPLMAYTAFGMWGVPTLLLMSGLISGFFLRFLKNSLSARSSYFAMTFSLVFYIYIGTFFINFFTMSYLDLVAMATLFLIIYTFRTTQKLTTNSA